MIKSKKIRLSWLKCILLLIYRELIREDILKRYLLERKYSSLLRASYEHLLKPIK